MTAKKTSLEMFEEQKKRHTALQQRLSRAQALRDAETLHLERAREEARTALKTDSVEDLRKLYREGEAENEANVVAWIFALDEVEQQLNDIDRQTATR